MKKRSSPKSPSKKAKPKATAKRAKTAKQATKKKPATFLNAFITLLESRGIEVPAGLEKAPAEAYAAQPASVVDLLANLSDGELRNQAERIAGYAQRKAQRAKAAWTTSPLIVELRKRGLKEPPAPKRVVGAAIQYRKPLREWTDDEIVEAATEWSRRGTELSK